jgi:predicted DNA-binding protein with PD1-like motif
MNRTRATAVLASVLLASGLASAQTITDPVVEGPAQYLSPSRISPTGKAPGMKVQLLIDQNGHKEYAVVFYKGDEAFSGLVEFAKKYNVTSAHFTAIGAIDAATIAWFNPARKMYKAMTFTGQMEVASMIGDIALYNGKPAIHTHAVIGFPDGTTRGGHVIEMHVRPTLEVMVTVDPIGMQKRFDPETDLTLIDPTTHP